MFFQDVGNKELEGVIRLQNSKDLTDVFPHHLLSGSVFPQETLNILYKVVQEFSSLNLLLQFMFNYWDSSFLTTVHNSYDNILYEDCGCL